MALLVKKKALEPTEDNLDQAEEDVCAKLLNTRSMQNYTNKYGIVFW